MPQTIVSLRRTVVVLAVALFGLAGTAAAGTIYNPTTVAQLQADVALVNAGFGGDTILLAPGVYPVASTLVISQDVTLQGDPNTASVIDGGGVSTLLLILATNVKVQNLTLQNAGIALDWQGTGGCALSGVTITGTTTDGFFTQSGGQVSVINSTIAYNTGRGLESESTTSPLPFGSPLSLTNVTISHNGVGVYTDMSISWSVANSLIVANTVDCHLLFLKGAASIDEDGTCAATPAPGPILVAGFSTVSPFPALGLDPNLGANGGPTLTEAIISPASPAIGAGNPDTCQFDVLVDQRGAARKSNCDIGAFEYGAVPAPNTPTGSGVSVSPFLSGPFSEVTVTFAQVTGAGTTTAVIGGPPPPSGFLVGGLVYDISTTATYTPPVTVCIPYDSSTNPTPHLYHFEGGAWVDKTTFTAVINFTPVVCGTVSSFSPFAVLVPIPSSSVSFKSFEARLELERSHKLTKHAADVFHVEGHGVLGAASNGIAPATEDVTLKLGPLSLTIPAGSFVKKVDKDDDHGKADRDDRITTYRFDGVVAGVDVTAKIEQGPKQRFRFQVEGRHATLAAVVNPVTVGLAIGDDAGQVVVKADIDR